MVKYSSIAVYTILNIAIFFYQGTAKEAAIPKHPSELKYSSLDWEVPLGSPFRTTLSNGLRLYIAEDNSLPLVSINGYFSTGEINDPLGKEGLGSFAVRLMRTGGTESIPSDSLDAIIDHFAISFSFSLLETGLVLNVSFLSQFTDTALYILDQILFHPAFEQEKIEKERKIVIQNILHRFDNPEPILNAAYRKAMYPEGANSRLSTESSIESITREDLLAFHDNIFKTENAIFAVSGDLDRSKFIDRLEVMFQKALKGSVESKFPSIEVRPAAKFYIVHKHISQTYIRLGLPMFKRPHPDYYSLSVFSMILGGASFISRLGKSVRSDAGLTYSIYSHAETNYIFQPTFYINFFTANPNVNKAIALTLREVETIVENGITNDELINTKKILIEGLPSMFRSKEDVVDTYAWNEYYDRSEDHYRVYPDKIKAIKRKDVEKAARKYIDPKEFTFVVVGDTTEIFKAEDSDGFSLKEQSGLIIITPDMLYKTDCFLKPE